jgi:hypothetical protein
VKYLAVLSLILAAMITLACDPAAFCGSIPADAGPNGGPGQAAQQICASYNR